jgi:hypothetical protein
MWKHRIQYAVAHFNAESRGKPTPVISSLVTIHPHFGRNMFLAISHRPAILCQNRACRLSECRSCLHHINQKLRTHNRLEAVMHAIHRKLF